MKSKLLSIILRKVAYGDSDYVVTFLSRDRGRMSGFAKSARKSVKRFGGGLEVGTLSNLEISEINSTKLPSLEMATVERSITGISKSLERISAMTRAVELSLKFLQEHESAPEKFDLLDAYLSFISQNDPDSWDALTFEYQWLSLCGFRPVVNECQACGCNGEELASGDNGFDVVDGGVLCKNCVSQGRATIFLSRLALEGFCAIETPTKRPDEESAIEALKIISRYVDHVAGKKLITSPIFKFSPVGEAR